MTSLHVIFGLALHPFKNPGYAYAGGGEGVGPCPLKSLLAPPKREQTFVLVQEDQQTFAQN